LNQLPNVVVKSIQDNTVVLELKGNLDDQQQLLKTLVMQDIPVVSLHEQKQSMQDVYLDIAKNQNKAPKTTKD